MVVQRLIKWLELGRNEDVASAMTDVFKGPPKTTTTSSPVRRLFSILTTADPNVYAPNYAVPKLYPRANAPLSEIVYQIVEIGRSQSVGLKSSWEWEWPSHRAE